MIAQGCPKCGGGGLIDHPRSGAITCPDKLADCDLCDGGGSAPEVVARRWRATHANQGRYWPGEAS